jgi:hypothetical protein
MSYFRPNRNQSISFRTYKTTNEEIEKLAAEVAKNVYHWHWQEPIRGCESKSGLINEVLSENITMAEIREKLKEREIETKKKEGK